ncbi:MAG: hypothetical protein IM674_01455 [Brevundimonas sp.]|nr:hypothetical protein [Brevundimonas sp.]
MPINDPYSAHAASASAPARRAEAVTPSDTVDLSAVAKSLYVGGPGDVRVQPAGGGAAVTLSAHPIGYLPVQVSRVLATGTTATSIVALFD